MFTTAVPCSPATNLALLPPYPAHRDWATITEPTQTFLQLDIKTSLSLLNSNLSAASPGFF